MSLKPKKIEIHPNMDIESVRQEIRKLISKNSSFNACKDKIIQYRDLAISKNDLNHIAYADFYESKIQEQRGNLIKAVQLVKKNISFFIKTKNNTFLQSSYLALGVYKAHLNNQDESLMYYIKATEIDSDLKQNKAIAYNNISGVFTNLKQYDNAIDKINKGLKEISLKNVNDRPLYFGMLLNLSNIYLLKNELNKTLEILQKIQKAQTKNPQDRIYGILHRNYGKYYAKLKDYELSLKHFDKAIAYYSEFKFNLALLQVIVLKAEALINSNKLNEAETLLLNAHNNYKNENVSAYNNLLCTLVQIYTEKGDTEKCKKFQTELDILTNS